MKIRFLLLAVGCLLSAVSAQWLETVVRPEPLTGVPQPEILGYTGKVYVGGNSPHLLAFDGATHQKVARVDLGASPGELCWNPLSDRLYCLAGHWVYVVDNTSGQVVDSIPAGWYARSLAFDPNDNRLFFAERDSLRLVVVDGSTNRITAYIPVGHEPCLLVHNPLNDKLYSTEFTGDSLSVIDAATNQIRARVRTGATFILPACSQFNNRLYVVRYDGIVTAIDGAGDTVCGTVALGAQAACIVASSMANRVYVSLPDSNRVSVIDGQTNQVIARIPVEDPGLLAFNPAQNKLYCISADNSIVVIDAALNAVIRAVPDSGTPVALQYDPAGDAVYAADYDSDDLTIVSGLGDSALAPVFVGDAYVYAPLYSTASNRLYCGIEFAYRRGFEIGVVSGADNHVISLTPVRRLVRTGVYDPGTDHVLYALDSGLVEVIDCATNQLVDSLVLSLDAFLMVRNPVLSRIYCAGPTGIAVIDPSLNQVVATITTPVYYPGSIACNPTGTRVYFVGSRDSTIRVIDASTNQIVDTILVGAPVYSVFYATGVEWLYAADDINNNVLVINPATGQVVATIPTMQSPYLLTANPDGSAVYCGCGTGDGVCVIDGNQHVLTDSLRINDIPNSLLYSPTTGLLYCGGLGKTIVVLNSRGDSIRARFVVEGEDADLAANEAYHRVYAAVGSGGIVVIRDVPSNAIAAEPSAAQSRPPIPTIVRGTLLIPRSLIPDTRSPITLFDINGRKVLDIRPSPHAPHPSSLSVDVSRLAPGVYFVRSADGGQRSAVKIVIQR